MKLFVAVTFALFVAVSAHGGSAAQTAFRKMISGASHVEVCRTAGTGKGYAVLLSSSDSKVIAAISDAFEVKDPVDEKSADGEEIIKLPCFCVAEYTVAFRGAAGSVMVFGLKHSLTAVLPPQPLGTDYLTDYDLTKSSSKRLRKMIERSEKKPNQSLEPTTLLGTSAAEQPLVPSRVVAHL